MASMSNSGNQVPGFDFLQDLMKSAGTAFPGMNAWIAPTLDPDELKKRIDELRTVQFWLEQNATLIGTTIQALEVQRMTLSTLKNLNVQVGDLGEALKIKVPDAADPGSAPAGPAASKTKLRKVPPETSPPTGLVDPMQWWGALTQQFAELAAQAVKDRGAGKLVDVATNLPAQAFKTANAATSRAGAAPRASSKTTRRRKA